MVDARLTPDTLRFLDTLRRHAGFFAPAHPLSVARAPGRLDVMGGIADYSGSLVLELPLGAAAFAGAQWSDDPGRPAIVRSVHDADGGGDHEVNVPLADLLGDYRSVRTALAKMPSGRWAAYVLGAVTVLHRERQVPFDRGLRILLVSDVPIGKGVSSSAAIEVAAMQAIRGLLDTDPVANARDLALLCQQVENAVVGAPCGVMDQMTAASGKAGALLSLLCQPAELQEPVAIPEDVEFFGIDSGIRHAVTGADYASVRIGAFMGYRIIAGLAGLSVSGDGPIVTVADSRWRGFLANVSPSEWDAEFRDRVPVHLSGAEFLAEYRGMTDVVTTVDPARRYAVRQPTAHPIFENARVHEFRSLLRRRPMSDRTMSALGELMYASHASYSACGLGSDGTDALVDLVRAAGPPQGLFGAKITGGGSGGTVAVLARRGAGNEVEAIARRYAQSSGRKASVLSGSSDGAATFGAMTIPAAMSL